MKSVVVMTGSLREGSINRQLTAVLERRAAGKLAFTHLDIGALPHYDEDLWSDPPQAVTAMKDQAAAADALIVVAPEYNRGFPGVVKNALDWGSRPVGKSCWIGKPAACTGASPGAIGTAVGQAHLRLSLLSCGMKVMHLPELYVQFTDTRFGPDGEVKDDKTAELIDKWIDAVVAWIG